MTDELFTHDRGIAIVIKKFNVFCYAILLATTTITGIQCLIGYAENYVAKHGLSFKGTLTISKKQLRYDQEPKIDNSKKSILLVKPWNSIGNRQCMTLILSVGAPLFFMCLCLQSRKDVLLIDIVEYTL